MDQKTTTFESGAGTRVPKWEPGLTKGTWGQKYLLGKLSKNINFDKIIEFFGYFYSVETPGSLQLTDLKIIRDLFHQL